MPALAAALGAEEVPRVREAIMTALMRIGDEASVMALLPYLRSQDAASVRPTIETLQNLPTATLPFMASLLGDSDTDVRILATELARNMPAADATHLLCGLLRTSSIPMFARRRSMSWPRWVRAPPFPPFGVRRTICRIPFLPFAVSAAIARISDAER